MVYVDNMRAPYGRMIMCHMISDTLEELHAMADCIGIQRKWFQGDHYDISLTKRTAAITAGAIEITQRQCGAMVARYKRTGILGTPHESELWLKLWFKQNKRM